MPQAADVDPVGPCGGECPGPLHPSEQGPDPGDDLAHRERLGEVVVGADAEPDEDVGLVGARREHEDGHGAHGLDAAAHLEAVEAGEHDVEHDEVGVVPLERRDGTGAVVGLLDDEALGPQAVADGLVDHRLVLHHEDAGAADLLGHAPSVGGRSCGPRGRRVEKV